MKITFICRNVDPFEYGVVFMLVVALKAAGDADTGLY